MEKFVALFDIHFGAERDGQRHKVPLHDIKAVNVALEFIDDFKPNHVILGGDILDCGAISHHTRGRVGQLEGLRLLADAKECHDVVIAPIEKIVKGRLVYHEGNHENWLKDLTDELPALEGIVDIRALLGMGKRWELISQGKASKLGRLVFVHGDNIKGGANPAKYAVEAYARNVFFGHHHTHAVYTKVSALDMYGHTGVAVPCLCKKTPRYGEGAPNRWMQGFLHGWIDKDIFSAQVSIIIGGKAIINGKRYKG